jgi:LPS export ABC transporter protein LptC
MIIAMISSEAPLRSDTRYRRARLATRSLLLAALVAAWATPVAAAEPVTAAPAPDDSQALNATGVTFVGSRGDDSELVLRSRFATFYPDRDLAQLREVEAVLTDEEDGDSFEMSCDRAELNVETNDFRAEGDVRGSTADGQHYAAPWVEYDHAAGLLRSDAQVTMVDDTGTFRGDGFRYRVADRTFRLLGNVSVEQGR